MTIADSFQAMGKSHTVCQDSARTIVTSDSACGVVCDGCSSSLDSEIGAILLSKLALQSQDPEFLLCQMQRVLDVLSLPNAVFNATLLCVRMDDTGFQGVAWGDGFFLIQKSDGLRRVIQIEYPSGAPAYLSYQLYDGDVKQYLQMSNQGHHVVITYDEQPDLTWAVDAVDLYGMDPYTFQLAREEATLVVVASDGLASFSNAGASLKWQDVLDSVFRYKIKTGEFIRRRLNMFLRTPQLQHYDDISFAGVGY